MNWKMTAKTILVQFHHKVDALEHIGKRLALVLQDHLLAYLRREFRFEHIRDVRIGDTMHIHAYRLQEHRHGFRLELGARISTDAAGVAKCLGIQAETKVDLETILAEVNRKMSSRTVLTLEGAATPVNEGLPGQ
jgi:hypothetical protein